MGNTCRINRSWNIIKEKIGDKMDKNLQKILIAVAIILGIYFLLFNGNMNEPTINYDTQMAYGGYILSDGDGQTGDPCTKDEDCASKECMRGYCT